MTGSYCEAALINGAATEECSGTVESKIKKNAAIPEKLVQLAEDERLHVLLPQW